MPPLSKISNIIIIIYLHKVQLESHSLAITVEGKFDRLHDSELFRTEYDGAKESKTFSTTSHCEIGSQIEFYTTLTYKC